MGFVKQKLALLIVILAGLPYQKNFALNTKTSTYKSKQTIDNVLDPKNLPKHIAIIMDGNGRWGIKHGKERTYGHKCAIKKVKEVIKECVKLKIKYLTFYGFSTENWKRDRKEVDFLMNLIPATITSELNELIKNNVKVIIIGDIDRLPENCKSSLKIISEKSKQNTGMFLIIALSYSSKWEISKAIKKIIIDTKSGIINESDVNENFINNYLETKDIPDPDLLIRTGGENRLSNFQLLQLVYTELYFTKVLWPDFTKKDLHKAIAYYQTRDRRFGGHSIKNQTKI